MNHHQFIQNLKCIKFKIIKPDIDLLTITFNSAIKLLVFLKINFKWVLDDSKGNLSVIIRM